MITRERLVISSVGLFLFVAAFGYTYLRFGPKIERVPPPVNRLETVLQEGAELVLRYVPQNGEIAWTDVISVSEELVGLTLTEVRGIHPDWNVLSFGPTRLVIDVPCVAEEPGGFVKSRAGRVAIYIGAINGCHELHESTEIEVETLPPSAREAVERGIPFEQQADIPQILEGLASTR